MICPNCEAHIDDDSVACPTCGTAVERKFCPTCGQAIGGGSNRNGVLLFIGFVVGAMVLIFVVDKTVDLTLPAPPARSNEAARPDTRAGYDIITRNNITIGEAVTEEWMIQVDSGADSDIVDAGLKAIEEARSEASYAQILVYVFVGDAYAVDQSSWTAVLSYFRPDQQTTANLTSWEKIGEDIYIRWQR